MKQVTIGIDGSNIISGGGKTHLVEMINASQPNKNSI